MINHRLMKLIKDYWIWEEDAIEIIRIFNIMTEAKKLEILEDWPKIASQILKHRQQIEKEKEVLLLKAIENIEHDIEEYNKTLVSKKAKMELKELKQK